jgi:ribosomal protein L7/L12
MIKLELTVREAMGLASNCSSDMYNKIVTAFEVALGVNQRRRVTITGGMNTDNRIMCIKSIRQHTGWSLKESKDWTDVIVGCYDSGVWINGGDKNTVTLETSEAAENLLRDLAGLGCEGFLS